jgi:subtilisin family serine protease
MPTIQQLRTNRLTLLVTILLLAGLLPWAGGVRAEPSQPTATPTRAPFAYGVSFLSPDGQVGTTYRGAPGDASALATAAPAELVAQTAARINDARQAAGLPTLLTSEALTAAANEHAADLLASGAFQHQGSDGSWPTGRAARHSYPVTYLSENLAVGYVTAQATVDAWLADDGSQANLLDPHFTHVGLAFAHNGPWHNYWVVLLSTPPAYLPGRVLVRFQPAVAAARVQETLAQVGAASLGAINSIGVERLAVPPGQEVAVVAALQQNPNVAFAEPDYTVQALLEPDDPYYAGKWWWDNIQAPSAWDVTTGSDAVTIAVIDTGVDLDHPDLAAKIVPGYDFVNSDYDPDDDHGHGTHVAGIAAAVTNNGAGVAGLSWGARIMPLKVLNSSGDGSMFVVAEAIVYAADHGAQVVNLSLGGIYTSDTMASAIDYAHGQGVFIAAAAGNHGDDTLLYPAANEHVVGVAATDSFDARASFSNYGTHVDVAAPGVSIYSTIMGGGYSYKNGTSMATPFVSGLAALVLSRGNDLTPDEVETIIEQSADDLGSPGHDIYYGWGRINAYQAIMVSPHTLEGAVQDLAGYGVAGVRITIAGSQTITTTTDSDGLFGQAGLYQDTYVVTPTLAALTFSPPTRTLVISDTDVTGVIFTAQVAQTFSIRGSVSMANGSGAPNVEVVIASEHLRLTTLTDAEGHFTQTGLISDAYVLTPTLGGVTFDPPSRTVVIAGADQTGADFIMSDFSAYLPAVFHTFATTVFPNDPYFEDESQWGLHNVGQFGGDADADIDAPEAWGLGAGSNSVIVAIVDTGVDLDHAEFSGRLTAGWDYVNNDSNPDDDNGHGTHVAGIAAATGNNGVGVAGVAWNVRIMPVKVLDNEGNGWYSDMIEGIQYAVGHQARVVNMSLSGIAYSQAMQDAVTNAYNNGVLVVAAAGNCRTGCWVGYQYYVNPPNYPAANAHTLGVAATTDTDTYSSFSNYGAYVDVAAPGSDILSTYVGGGYEWMDGTSMATPFVSGLAALVYSAHPEYTPTQAAQAIVHNADDLGPLGRDDTYGCGRINAHSSQLNGAVSSGCTGWGGLSVENVAAAATPPANARFRPGVLLVKFKDTTILAQRENVLSAHDLTIQSTIEGLAIHLVAAPQGQELTLMKALNADPAIAYAEPDYQVYALPAQPRPQVAAVEQDR